MSKVKSNHSNVVQIQILRSEFFNFDDIKNDMLWYWFLLT